MSTALKSSWALLVGIGLIMLGNGLQTSLLGLRAVVEGFPTAATGMIMSAFYVGFLAGSQKTPQVVARVGHIRVFAAWAAMAAVAILLHGLIITPISWVATRLVTGFCYAGMYVVAESWLNERADNRTRGQLLSAYMVVQYLGLSGGQLMLNLGNPGELTLFMWAALVISLAIVPISLTSVPATAVEAQEPMGLKTLLKLSPLGVITCAGAGLSTGALLGMGAVFAERSGFSLGEVSIFMALLILGTVCFQFPVGWISDWIGRRKVIIIVGMLATLVAVLAYMAMDWGSAWVYGLIFIVGGVSMPLYSVGIAYANDELRPSQMVAASSSLVMTFGLGAALGPVGVAAMMDLFGPGGFYISVGLVHMVLVVFALFRTTQRRPPSLEEQGSHQIVRGGTGARLRFK